MADREEFADDDWEGLSGSPNLSPPPAVEAASSDRIDTIFPVPGRRRGLGRAHPPTPTQVRARPQAAAAPRPPPATVSLPRVPATHFPRAADVAIPTSIVVAGAVGLLCGVVLIAVRLACQSSFPTHMWHAQTGLVMLVGAILTLTVGVSLHRRWRTRTVLFGLIGALVGGAAEIAAPVGIVCAVIVQLATRGDRNQPDRDQR